MVILARLTESFSVYEPDGLYMYRVHWSVDYGFKLQRRLKPVSPNEKFNLWDRSKVESYSQLNQFEPAGWARPTKSFETLKAIEDIIRADVLSHATG